MNGGIDRGPCLFYWALSYRRKLIRTVWFAGITLLTMVLLQVGGIFPDPEGWVFIGLVAVVAVGQAACNWFRWKDQRLDSLSAERSAGQNSSSRT